CNRHEQQVYLPVIPITSSCNMNCSICYTINKNNDPYNIPINEFRSVVKRIRENNPSLKIINLTGGEPTLHPKFIDILKICNEEGIERVTVSTNGLLLINNDKLLKTMSELKTRVVLSFDSFNEKINLSILGRDITASKLQILKLLDEYNIDTTLIPVLIQGFNDAELGDIVKLVLSNNFLRSLEIHSMTFTGQGGASFNHKGRITTYDILNNIETQTDGLIKVSDFMPAPVAHSLCYLTTYILILNDGDYVPYNQFISKDDMIKLQTGNLYIEPGEKLENILRDAISNLWSGIIEHEKSDQILKSLKELLKKMFRKGISYSEQQYIAERSTKAIYIHSHMDEWTFDTKRIKQCCVAVPELDGTHIPTCSYNVLYREQDKRFSKTKELVGDK
ncbi:MAG: radical SAM protein, partial [Spirochaetota bacterium]|nr:radical SAM protein [Spirochaetota bacterium]